MSAFDTVPAMRTSQHIVGALEVAACSTRVLYRLPRGPAASEAAVAFPGDAVPWPAWPSIAGAVGNHPHSSGLLGALGERLPPAAALFVLEPSRISDRFAIYDSLLADGESSLTASGEPASAYDGRSLRASSAIAACLDAAWAHAADASPRPADLPLLAFGFSKGGVVVSQLLAELGAYSAGGGGGDCSAEGGGHALLERLAALHYLDAGTSGGGAGAHLTDEALLAAIGRRTSPPLVAMHGTPRQWEDASRPWLRAQAERQAEELQRAGIPTRWRMYFQGEAPSLAMHFGVVAAFEP